VARPATKRQLHRAQIWGAFLVLGLLLGLIAAREARTSALQARWLAGLNERLHFALAPGPSASFVAPRHGPYDDRLGYVRLPEWVARLRREGFAVHEQATLSPTLARISALGLTPPYDEKTQAGLSVLDRAGHAVFQVTEPAEGYAHFEAIPKLVRETLLFVENRELLHKQPRRNPAIEWDRFARAALLQLGGGNGDTRGPGGSTLATQMEKYRHSPGGRTTGPLEKLRQRMIMIGDRAIRVEAMPMRAN
jgi:membrane peptidoglycan carboxypeptidase